MKILAIETSCDETSVAIADFSRTKVRVFSHIVLSQIPVHKKFGGVVPNLAKREHQKNLVPLLLQALQEAGFKNLKHGAQNAKSQAKIKKLLEREQELWRYFQKYILPLKMPSIDAIAVTYGPGLEPALWVGVNFARALAYLWKKPIIPVNHMLGHLYSAYLQPIQKATASRFSTSTFKILKVKHPALALLVSGGHTELVLSKNQRNYTIIGETLDDAAGEAFDKAARILGLGYPGGPEISRLAESEVTKLDKIQFRLPRPMLNSKDYNFSFSGLKTAVLYLTRDLGRKKTKDLRPLLAKEFQEAVVEVLVKKTVRAAQKYNAKTVLLGGGVSANKLLRKELSETLSREIPKTELLTAPLALSGDNALMIAAAAYFQKQNAYRRRGTKHSRGYKEPWNKISADANLRIS